MDVRFALLLFQCEGPLKYFADARGANRAEIAELTHFPQMHFTFNSARYAAYKDAAFNANE